MRTAGSNRLRGELAGNELRTRKEYVSDRDAGFKQPLERCKLLTRWAFEYFDQTGTNQHAQLAVPARVGRRRPTYPGIKATPRDVENLTQVSDRYGGLLLLDERESYSLSFAKKAAAFLNTSRSIRNRRFSLRSRRSSSRSTPVKPVRPFDRSARA